MLGVAPARPVVDADARIGIAPPANFGSEIWGGNKVLWTLSRDTEGPALIRGHQLDGPGEARFDDGPIPATEKILDPTNKVALDGGWYDFPGSVRLSTPGCYGFQIEVDGRSWTVILEAEPVA